MSDYMKLTPFIAVPNPNLNAFTKYVSLKLAVATKSNDYANPFSKHRYKGGFLTGAKSNGFASNLKR